MNVKCCDIERFMGEWAPSILAEDWDNVGLLLGNSKADIKKVLISLDVTPEVAKEAAEKKADLILSHHPLIFSGLKRLNENDPKGEVISKLIRNNIAVFAAHTNLDVADGGVNDCLAEALELKNIKNLNFYKVEKLQRKEYGLGKIGYIDETLTFDKFIDKVKAKLGIKFVKVIGKMPVTVKKAAVFCGSFDGNLENVLEQEVDVLVTGDIKYHTAHEIADMGVCVVDAGHFATERIIIPRIAEKLKDRFPELEVLVSEVEEDPIKTC